MQDLIGRQFGKLIVVSREEDYVSPKGTHKSRWLCQCECGNTTIVTGDNLRSGNTTTCGCMRLYKEDWTGYTFGKLTIIKEVTPTHNCRRMLCRCECGNEKKVDLNHLSSGKILTCGCRPRPYEDLTGQIFGYLKVISENMERYKLKQHYWNCECLNCGAKTVVSTNKLKIGHTKSCGCISSYGEKQIAKILKEYHIEFEKEYTFKDLKSKYGQYLRFDFCVLNKENIPQYLIEYQGIQHFENTFNLSDEEFQESIERDKLKREYCLKHNIPLIEIRYDEEIIPEKLLMFKTKGIEDESFLQYKKPSMFVSNTICDFKCDKENNTCLCINKGLVLEQTKMVTIDALVQRYKTNPITSAIVFGGLENFDEFEQLFNFIKCFRRYNQDDIVVYTGFYKNEIQDKIKQLTEFSNIIVKFGRFIPNQQPHYDEVLGIKLASDNQYAERIS